MRKITLASLVVACFAGSASASVLPSTFNVVNDNPTGAIGSTISLGDVKASDVLSFTVSGTPYLQGPGLFGVNAAGVTTTTGLAGIIAGDSLRDLSSGFTYGALIATLNGSTARQVFATNAANGLGQSNPPATLRFSGTLASLFGVTGPLTGATINFHVDDSYYGDNSGSFVITAASLSDAAAVPEPATWAMMMLGFGGMGYAMRRKNKVSTRIKFA